MRIGAVDIGTNSMKLLVADLAHGRLVEVAREVHVTRLGHGLDTTGVLAEAAIERTVDILERFGHLMNQAKVTRRRAVATSASRDAANVHVFLDGAEAALGVRPEVVAGEEEARLAFAGATLASEFERTLVIDLGGGSTEFVAGSSQPEYASSVDIGSVRLTDRMPDRRPTRTNDVSHARAEVRAMFAELALPAVDGVIGVAGTYTTLSAVRQELPEYDRQAVHGSQLTLRDLDELVQQLCQLTIREISAIPSMDPRRAPVVVAGAIVAEEALRASGHDVITVSEMDILDGIALSFDA
ncbi:MAG: Ppx/GppA family phosphatase [Acidimicrobiia bacterium]|nr:Ppx/GppA family phosphatase [Acidimicrobiia bacterium]